MNWLQLKTAVKGWANRSDIDALLPTFLDLAEQRIYYGAPDFADPNASVDPLRLSVMLTGVTPFAGGALPADCLQIERIAVDAGTPTERALEFRTLERITPQLGLTGAPAFYTVKGASVLFGPSFDNTAQLDYYARPATPSADTDVNWVMANASSIYLYAMLVEVGQWLRDAAMRDEYLGLFANAMRSVQDNDDQQRHSGSTLRIASDQGYRR